MSERTEALASQIDAHLSGRVRRVASLKDEVTYEVDPAELLSVCRALRDTPELKFEMLMDVAGVDYLHYGRDEWQTETATRSGFSRGRVARTTAPDPNMPGRFAVVYHLLSITHNRRMRLRVKCADVKEPVVDSVNDVWSAANWFEREAFDLFGNLLREANAARALDATGHVRCDQGPEVFILHRAFALVVTGQVTTKSHREVLELTLTALVADGAIQRVVDEKEFHRRPLRTNSLRGLGKDLHPFRHRRRTGWQRLRRLLDFNQAHAAVSRNGQLLVVTEARHVRVVRIRDVNDHRALARLHRHAVDFHIYEFFSAHAAFAPAWSVTMLRPP